MKFNTQLKLLTTSVILATSVNVMADTFEATVTVKNSFDITEDTPLDFGTIRANAVITGPSTDTANIVFDPETGVGTATDGTAATMGQLIVGTPGAFTVSGLAPYQALDIDTTQTAELKLVPHPTGGAFFNVDTFTFFVTSLVTPALYAASGDLIADATGNATFTVGATLTTSDVDTDGNSAQYQETAYVGDYEINISYP